ncbi:MAG: hypothetical protein FWH11_11495 [Micrococcales bacterium]|nr:hypothetical protein [Micrococcales bacterium]
MNDRSTQAPPAHVFHIKAEQFPWMREVTKCAPQEAIIDLGRAFANFFAGRAGTARPPDPDGQAPATEG